MILRMCSLFLAYSALNLVKSFAYFFKVGKKMVIFNSPVI